MLNAFADFLMIVLLNNHAKEIPKVPKTYEPPASDVTVFTFRFL